MHVIKSAILACAAGIVVATGSALAQADPEIYGAIPDVGDVQISPDGSTVAMLRTVDGVTSVVFVDLDDPQTKPFGVRLKRGEARSLTWADDDHVLMLASDLGRMQTTDGLKEIEFFRWFAVSKSKAKPVVLFGNEGNYYISSSGVLISTLPLVEGKALIARYSVYGGSYDVFEVDLDTSRADTEEGGVNGTFDWLASGDGEIIARVDYNNSREKQLLYTRSGEGEPFRKLKEYDEGRGEDPVITFYGEYGANGDLIASVRNDAGIRSLVQISRQTGEEVQPIFEHPKYDIDTVVYDYARATATGVRYIDDMPRTVFFDPEEQNIQEALESALPQATPMVVSWSTDRSRLIVKAVYTDHPPQYFLFDKPAKSLSMIAASYEALDGAPAARKERYDYVSSDGLTIPGYLTVPIGADKSNMPLVVLPHGGPRGRDDMTFDWWPFFYAARGYLVYQPNFRGSDGYGEKFLEAGYGEWGLKMQDDITEGVKKLIADGMVDPDRICIVGGSYGGYAALAGATLTPDLYSCAVSVNGVTSITALLGRTVRAWGIPEDYWEIRVGSRFRDEEALDDVSPSKIADRAGPPIMLIHSRDDIVVPYSHAIRMYDELRKAKKPVELVELKGEDHWLSQSRTRTKMLSRSIDFIDAHIGPEAGEAPD